MMTLRNKPSRPLFQVVTKTTSMKVFAIVPEELDASQVRAGCDEELEYMRQMSVWDRIPRAQARDKVIGTRWVYVKKPNQVRCRLVAQEFAGSEKREDLDAGTPPYGSH